MAQVFRFDYELVRQLQASKELLLYTSSLSAAPGARSIVQGTWPTRGGIKLLPRQFVDLLSKQGLHLPCFCPSVAYSSLDLNFSAQIIVDQDPERQECYAYCHYDQPHCGYFLDLKKIYDECKLVSELPSGPVLDNVPYVGYPLVHYLNQKLDSNISPFPPAFISFIGEPSTSMWHETKITMLKQLRYKVGKLPGPKHIQSTQAPIDLYASDRERDALKLIADGGALSIEQIGDIIQGCVRCGKYVLIRLGGEHLAKFTGGTASGGDTSVLGKRVKRESAS